MVEVVSQFLQKHPHVNLSLKLPSTDFLNEKINKILDPTIRKRIQIEADVRAAYRASADLILQKICYKITPEEVYSPEEIKGLTPYKEVYFVGSRSHISYKAAFEKAANSYRANEASENKPFVLVFPTPAPSSGRTDLGDLKQAAESFLTNCPYAKILFVTPIIEQGGKTDGSERDFQHILKSGVLKERAAIVKGPVYGQIADLAIVPVSKERSENARNPFVRLLESEPAGYPPLRGAELLPPAAPLKPTPTKAEVDAYCKRLANGLDETVAQPIFYPASHQAFIKAVQERQDKRFRNLLFLPLPDAKGWQRTPENERALTNTYLEIMRVTFASGGVAERTPLYNLLEGVLFRRDETALRQALHEALSGMARMDNHWSAPLIEFPEFLVEEYLSIIKDKLKGGATDVHTYYPLSHQSMVDEVKHLHLSTEERKRITFIPLPNLATLSKESELVDLWAFYLQYLYKDAPITAFDPKRRGFWQAERCVRRALGEEAMPQEVPMYQSNEISQQAVTLQARLREEVCHVYPLIFPYPAEYTTILSKALDAVRTEAEREGYKEDAENLAVGTLSLFTMGFSDNILEASLKEHQKERNLRLEIPKALLEESFFLPVPVGAKQDAVYKAGLKAWCHYCVVSCRDSQQIPDVVRKWFQGDKAEEELLALVKRNVPETREPSDLDAFLRMPKREVQQERAEIEQLMKQISYGPPAAVTEESIASYVESLKDYERGLFLYPISYREMVKEALSQMPSEWHASHLLLPIPALDGGAMPNEQTRLAMAKLFEVLWDEHATQYGLWAGKEKRPENWQQLVEEACRKAGPGLLQGFQAFGMQKSESSGETELQLIDGRDSSAQLQTVSLESISDSPKEIKEAEVAAYISRVVDSRSNGRWEVLFYPASYHDFMTRVQRTGEPRLKNVLFLPIPDRPGWERTAASEQELRNIYIEIMHQAYAAQDPKTRAGNALHRILFSRDTRERALEDMLYSALSGFNGLDLRYSGALIDVSEEAVSQEAEKIREKLQADRGDLLHYYPQRNQVVIDRVKHWVLSPEESGQVTFVPIPLVGRFPAEEQTARLWAFYFHFWEPTLYLNHFEEGDPAINFLQVGNCVKVAQGALSETEVAKRLSSKDVQHPKEANNAQMRDALMHSVSSSSDTASADWVTLFPYPMECFDAMRKVIKELMLQWVEATKAQYEGNMTLQALQVVERRRWNTLFLPVPSGDREDPFYLAGLKEWAQVHMDYYKREPLSSKALKAWCAGNNAVEKIFETALRVVPQERDLDSLREFAGVVRNRPEGRELSTFVIQTRHPPDI